MIRACRCGPTQWVSGPWWFTSLQRSSSCHLPAKPADFLPRSKVLIVNLLPWHGSAFTLSMLLDAWSSHRHEPSGVELLRVEFDITPPRWASGSVRMEWGWPAAQAHQAAVRTMAVLLAAVSAARSHLVVHRLIATPARRAAPEAPRPKHLPVMHVFPAWADWRGTAGVLQGPRLACRLPGCGS